MENISQIMEQITAFLAGLRENAAFAGAYGSIIRYVLPVLVLLILVRCAKSLLAFRKEPEIWAWLELPDGNRLPVTHWENVIGRARGSDIVIDVATISKSHAVLTRYDDGSWTVSDIGSRGGVYVNGEQTEIVAIDEQDVITLGNIEMRLVPNSRLEQARQASSRTKAGRLIKPGVSLFLLTILQLLTMLQLIFTVDAEYLSNVAFGFLLLAGIQWLLFLVMKLARRHGFEAETIAFLLSTIGLSVIASAEPSSMFKQIGASVGGILVYLVVGWALRDLERAKKIRYIAVAIGAGLLLLNLAIGTEQYGAKNWIFIGGFSFQPSELVKICFIFAGASTLERIVTRRNLILFIGYSAFLCGCLALMNDFGTALIFFVAFLVIAYMRSGSFATIALISAATGFAGVFALKFKPHIANRFSAWGHVWEFADSTGYQQTRAMMVIASGGLFGLGLGNGWLKYVAASDTDLVFAFVSEEWGLLVSIMMVACIIVLSAFVVRSASLGRSSFYNIGACAAITILMTQTILNVFGTVDLLPLTGVTFPFVSNGGSSMLSSWGLLAFIKAADTRQNASFAIKLPSQRELRAELEDAEPEEYDDRYDQSYDNGYDDGYDGDYDANYDAGYDDGYDNGYDGYDYDPADDYDYDSGRSGRRRY